MELFSPPNVSVKVCETPIGALVIRDTDHSLNDYNLIEVPDGDFEKYIPSNTVQSFI